MNTIYFLAEWALRSSILILSCGLLLWALRLKDPSIRLAAWVAVLFGSLAMPLFTAEAPRIPVIVTRTAARPIETGRIPEGVRLPSPTIPTRAPVGVVKPFDWGSTALVVYVVVTLGLLLRLAVGLTMSHRLLHACGSTGLDTEGVEIRESDIISAPVTLGIARPAIVLPAGWRDWSSAKLDAVLAHERSHIRRFDPALQLLSAIHRALLWHSPFSWFLHNRIVRVAEEASDDAAIAVIPDRAFYAEVIVGFLRLGVRGSGPGVPMARYGRPEARINRILEGSVLSQGLKRGGLTAILLVAAPLTFLVAAAHVAEQTENAPAPKSPQTHASAPTAPGPAPAPRTQPETSYLRGLGSVAASYTVVIKSRIEGLLTAVNFREGEPVQQGQSLATIDTRPFEIQFMQAQKTLEQDQMQLKLASQQVQSGTAPETLLPQLAVKVSDDEAAVANAKLRLEYADIRSPINGVAGLRMLDAGNVVGPGQPIVIITEIQPAMVLFTVPEEVLPQVRRSLANGGSPVAEAWNRDNTIKISSGHLAAIDNQIDEQTGTAKLKAIFDNNDGALFPGQFVNVRLMVRGR